MTATNDGASDARKTKVKKVIKGNLPYTRAPGLFKKALEGIITAVQPERFTSDFMGTVLSVPGSSSQYVPPLLKKMGFLTTDGTPTDLYTSFRTEGSRSAAAYSALKNAFAELFQRNEFIHKAPESEVKDHIVAITGLAKNDEYVATIWSTFKTLRDFITSDLATQPRMETGNAPEQVPTSVSVRGEPPHMGLVNNINIVLPESTNITVYNIIFQSLRANLLS